MKKILVALLVAVLLLSVVGCNKTLPDVSDNTDENKENKPIIQSLYVSDLVNKSENLWGNNEDGSAWFLQYSMRLPELNFSEDIDEIINTKVYEIFYSPIMKDIENKVATFEVNYEVFEDEQYLSLLTVMHQGFSTNGYTVFTAIIDKNSKRILSFDDVIKQLEIDNKGLDNLEEFYDDCFYLNQNGELCIFYNSTTLACVESLNIYNLSTNEGGNSAYVPN